MELTTDDIEIIFEKETEVLNEYPRQYLAKQGKSWFLNEVLNRYKQHKDNKR